MYLVPIHVPIFVRGSELLLSTDWRRSLLLLRDSFNGRYGRLRVVAPSIDEAQVVRDLSKAAGAAHGLVGRLRSVRAHGAAPGPGGPS